jgi:regulator of ribonuclease activity A
MKNKRVEYVLPDLCDEFPEKVQVATPMFKNYGGRNSFGGEIVTIKCHEDNSLVAQEVDKPGAGKVLIVDGGGSLRCGLLGDNLAQKAADNLWEGIVIYGCIRDVDEISEIHLAVQALASNPMKSVKRNVGRSGESLHFADVRFIPGEFAYGDNNGLLVSTSVLIIGES